MKYIFPLILSALLSGIPMNAKNQQVIPQPASYSISEGYFKVPAKWDVYSDLSLQDTDNLLSVLKHPYEISPKDKTCNLIIEKDTNLAEEAYDLNISEMCVRLSAATEKGFFYGLQTLYQLAYVGNQGKREIMCCEISDQPRFEHRGMMLDVARYFIPKEEVLKLIDAASALKLNRLHLHLTDDNGWRIEIKKYPKLTETGAWRVERPEIFPGRKNPESAEEPTPIGGFYTQEDLKEIVEYASSRHIEVIPEIEMPAHAAAAIASYPELACPVVDKFVGVFPGIGGSDAAIIMCAGNDNVYKFYQDVLDEVMEIFPSQYIHLGGDEANKAIWEQCELCKAKLEKENLKDYEELQAYFMDTINHYVRSKGKTAMGWDEVTYGDPKEEMIILGWQGDGKIAVNDSRKSNRKFIMTPAKTLYLIRYQGPQWFEPFTYFGNNTLKDVYDYEPVEKDWTPELTERLLGIQGSLWTEFCSTPEDVEYLLFPRLVALADAAWRPQGSEDWDGFISALDNYFPELDNQDINFARSLYNIQHKSVPTGEGLSVSLDCIYPFAEIKYVTDGTIDTTKYASPIFLNGHTRIIANTYKDKESLGMPLILDFEFNQATGKNVSSENCNNNLASVLTNGLRGSDRISDFEWAGWHGKDAEFIVDLGEKKKINNATLGTIGFTDICVAMPESVELLISNDGINFTSLAQIEMPEELIWTKENQKKDLDFKNLNTEGRFVKIKAKNPGKIPEGFARDGNNTWLYFDEFIID
ncbi:MAG: family 20 glycosylhydrolase [Muribaculaceae bacterium]|nr:family 20 glycosylhydrolase [Muribaculaceae bacterium]